MSDSEETVCSYIYAENICESENIENAFTKENGKIKRKCKHSTRCSVNKFRVRQRRGSDGGYCYSTTSRDSSSDRGIGSSNKQKIVKKRKENNRRERSRSPWCISRSNSRSSVYKRQNIDSWLSSHDLELRLHVSPSLRSSEGNDSSDFNRSQFNR